jgi:hypothetical protein
MNLIYKKKKEQFSLLILKWKIKNIIKKIRKYNNLKILGIFYLSLGNFIICYILSSVNFFAKTKAR